jgi:hypothetical protein
MAAERQSRKTKEKNPEERVLIVDNLRIEDWLAEELYRRPPLPPPLN